MPSKRNIKNRLCFLCYRYYRLWIYTCNAVLLMAVIVFCGVAGKVLLADYKRLLVNGLNLGQPSFIYAYLALLVQSGNYFGWLSCRNVCLNENFNLLGFLQLIGCLGALRLSEKLLNAYWLLLLVLLIGDAILGVFWMFKFERIMQGLQPMLRWVINRHAHMVFISTNKLDYLLLFYASSLDGFCANYKHNMFICMQFIRNLKNSENGILCC